MRKGLIAGALLLVTAGPAAAYTNTQLAQQAAADAALTRRMMYLKWLRDDMIRMQTNASLLETKRRLERENMHRDYDQYRRFKGGTRSAGRLPDKIFIRSVKPIRRPLWTLKRRVRPVGGIVARMGGSGSFSFGRDFASRGPGGSFNFGALKQGAPSFSFGAPGRR